MYTRVVPILTILILAAALSAAAQPAVLTIDLSVLEPNAERTLSVEPGTYSVQIVNKAPALKYRITVAKSFLEVPPLPPVRGGAAPLLPNDPCKPLSDAAGQLRNTQDEREVAQLVPRIASLLAEGRCLDATITDPALRLMAATREQPGGPQSLDLGRQVKVTVVAVVGTATRTWTVVYQTAPRGRWGSSYGFTFLPNRDERFFSAKTAEANKYIITEKKDRQDLAFAPSIFFSWFPTKDEERDWSFSWSAGLGFDQSNPIVFAGPMWTYHQNIGFMLGLVMHKQKRLNGQYDKNQEVTENLTEAQLNEETYRPNLFFGLSLRFGSNPFTTSSGSTSSAATPSGSTPSSGNRP
jgi:hypothetical protein